MRVLRLGVISGGRIIEERLLRAKETVTVGTAPSCTVMLPEGAGPARATLLAPSGEGDAYVLRLDTGTALQGKVTVGGVTLDLGAVRATEVRLDAAARGKLAVGDVTVLFQQVEPPTPAPRPVLPAALRGGLFSDVDWTFLASFLVVALAATPTVWALERVPIPKEVTLADVPDRVSKFIIVTPEWTKIPMPDGATTAEPGGDDATAAADPADGATAGGDGPSVARGALSPEERARLKAEHDTRILDAAHRTAGLVGIIGSARAGGRGAIVDVLSGGGFTGDADEALKGMTGVTTATTDTAGVLGGRDGGLDVGPGKVSDLAAGPLVGPVGTADAGHKGDEKPMHGTVTGTGPTHVDPGLTPEQVRDAVKARLGAVRTCYETRLTHKGGKLDGKIRMRWTINGAGRVDRTSIEPLENGTGDDALSACVADRIAGWRFPEPESGVPTTVEFPFVFTASGD